MESEEPRLPDDRSMAWLDSSGNDDTLFVSSSHLFLVWCFALRGNPAQKLTLGLTGAQNDGNAGREKPCEAATEWADD